MKIRTLVTSIALTVIFFSNIIFAQISSYGKPYSFKHSVEKSDNISKYSKVPKVTEYTPN